jgi:hypothetical protein
MSEMVCKSNAHDVVLHLFGIDHNRLIYRHNGIDRRLTGIHGDVIPWVWCECMTEFWRDVKFGARLLSQSPVFTLTAILLLAIGISANTLIFSVVDAILLRPLPVPHPEQLVRLIEVHSTGFVNWTFPYDVCDALAARDASLSEVIVGGDMPGRDRCC